MWIGRDQARRLSRPCPPSGRAAPGAHSCRVRCLRGLLWLGGVHDGGAGLVGDAVGFVDLDVDAAPKPTVAVAVPDAAVIVDEPADVFGRRICADGECDQLPAECS